MAVTLAATFTCIGCVRESFIWTKIPEIGRFVSIGGETLTCQREVKILRILMQSV